CWRGWKPLLLVGIRRMWFGDKLVGARSRSSFLAKEHSGLGWEPSFTGFTRSLPTRSMQSVESSIGIWVDR
ncbi:hypothetical protein D5S18_30235, partial [Nocardia panacis]